MLAMALVGFLVDGEVIKGEWGQKGGHRISVGWREISSSASDGGSMMGVTCIGVAGSG